MTCQERAANGSLLAQVAAAAAVAKVVEEGGTEGGGLSNCRSGVPVSRARRPSASLG